MDMIIGFFGLVVGWLFALLVGMWDWLTDLPAIVWVAFFGFYWLSRQLEAACIYLAEIRGAIERLDKNIQARE